MFCEIIPKMYTEFLNWTRINHSGVILAAFPQYIFGLEDLEEIIDTLFACCH